MIQTEAMVKPCGRCGIEVKREMPTAEQPFAKWLREMPFHCNPCQAEIQAEEDAERRDAEREQRRKDFERRIQESGLPRKHWETLDELAHPAHIIEACREWASAKLLGLLLVGEIGRGKTTLAGAAAFQALGRRPVIWTSAPLLFARLGSGFQSEQREWAVQTLAGRRALVLDDIDKARPTEYGAEQVFLAVDQRVEHRVPLLVTSNLDPDGIANYWPDPFGSAIASRLVGYCRVVKVDGQDRRLV